MAKVRHAARSEYDEQHQKKGDQISRPDDCKVRFALFASGTIAIAHGTNVVTIAHFSKEIVTHLELDNASESIVE